MGEMFKDPVEPVKEPEIVDPIIPGPGPEDIKEPVLQLPESKDCNSKRECGAKFCLQPPEGGTGKCVPKSVYVSNMKQRKRDAEA